MERDTQTSGEHMPNRDSHIGVSFEGVNPQKPFMWRRNRPARTSVAADSATVEHATVAPAKQKEGTRGEFGVQTPVVAHAIGRVMFRLLATDADAKFAIDTLKRVIVFLVVACSAQLLNAYIGWMERVGTAPVIVLGFSFVEALILIGDIVWFTRRQIAEVSRHINLIVRLSWTARIMIGGMITLAALIALSCQSEHTISQLIHSNYKPNGTPMSCIGRCK